MKTVFLIADGMGDWPIEELGNMTPLQAAHTPMMDTLCKSGECGICQTVPEGMPPGSDVANMSLLGYSPADYHTGRGPIEAAAQGLTPGANDLVWRLNLVTTTDMTSEGVMKDYSAGHIQTEVSHELIKELQEQFGNDEFSFHPGVQYRHTLIQKNGALTLAKDLLINPPHDILDKSIINDLTIWKKYPQLFNLIENASNYLEKSSINSSKANAIWPWGQGKPLTLPSFESTFGLKGAVVSAVDLVKGLGRAAEMTVLDIPGATGLVDTNYQGKVEATLEFLEHGDFVYVHLEGPDESGHGGNAEEKTEAISRFDEQIVKPIYEAIGDDAVVVITCDHLTPVALRTHHADPVPYLITWPNAPQNSLTAFSEDTARSTGNILPKGIDLLPRAISKRS